MSSNRRANAARNRRERNGQLTRNELKKKYGAFGSFREDPEENRQYQLDSGALKSKLQGDPKTTAKSKFLGNSGTVGDFKQNQTNQTKSKKMSPSYLSYPVRRKKHNHLILKMNRVLQLICHILLLEQCRKKQVIR